ncbi:ABC transporter permease [Modestobacter versicolor]|uniref:ABC transporter permease n=1 Tax=Modestobacter versicolor TaxID=429133 RepID=A0A323V9H7_9ACTN|nr:ABC transporter permease [Modestobacter versicolor]MBB3675278.1 ABC-type transport system involved in multi-copper enzyme maturation permease subunit [Modestobacter versicolor]PZA21507.1 ABC transporter permease [Modestobacter versicolor]
MSAATLDAGRPRTLPEPTPPSLPTLVRVELRKSYDTRAGKWLLVTIGLAALAVVAISLFVEDAPKTFPDYFSFTQLPVAILLPVLGILLVTSEWSQRTAMTTFTLVPRRSRVLTAKVLAASVLGVLGVLATVAATVLATVLTPVVTDQAMDWSLSGAQAGQVLLVQVLFVLSGVAFGMLLLSSPLAIVLYFVLPTVFTIVVNLVSALDWVRDWLDLGTTSQPMFEGELDGQGWVQLATSAVVWIVLPMAIGWVRIQRSEIA